MYPIANTETCSYCNAYTKVVEIPYTAKNGLSFKKKFCYDCLTKITMADTGLYTLYQNPSPLSKFYKGVQKPTTIKKPIKRDTEKYCDYCGNLTLKTDLISVNGSSFCKTCIDTYYYLCEWCGKYHRNYERLSELHELAIKYPVFLDNHFTQYVESDGAIHYNVSKICFKYAVIKRKAEVSTTSCVECGNTCVVNPVEGENSYCKVCLKNKFKCDICKEVFYHKHNVLGDKKLCTDCFEINLYHSCPRCGKWFLPESKVKPLTSTRVSLCNDCSELCTPCFCCGTLINNSDLKDALYTYDNLTTPLCYSCRKRRICVECSAPILSQQTVGDSSLCSKCLASKLETNTIQEYDYVIPSFVRHGYNKDNLYLGFENEMYVRNKSVKKDKVLANIMKNYKDTELYCVFDGSIGGQEEEHCKYGFELVSHLYTLTAAKKVNWVPSFRGCRLHPTCGMHVHLTRSAFTTFHLYKFMLFIYNNTPFIDAIGERGENLYAKNLDGSLIIKHVKRKIIHKGIKHIYRRVKVNLCNKGTIELRFFSSVVTQTGLFKNLEFAHALFYFTRDTSKRELTTRNFINFINKRKDKYKCLVSFINRKVSTI